MHHVVLERWSRGSSLLHRCDARVKIVLLLCFLVSLATTGRVFGLSVLLHAFLAATAIAAGRLPAGALVARAAAVLPFSAVFALFSFAGGDAAGGAALLTRSYLSAAAVLVLAGTTPLPQLLHGLESLGVPSFLVLVVQFLYRYLFVISEQAQHMRQAAQCRGGGRKSGFRAAAGAVSVLFARSYDRAQGIHNAMLSRSYAGRMPVLSVPRVRASDALVLALGVALILACRAGAGAIR